jgi:serine/threonine protein kinase
VENDAGSMTEAVGRYKVTRVLGRGSYGVVLLGELPNPGRSHSVKRAIKTVPCDFLDEAAAARSKNEALNEGQLLLRFRHPHIVCCWEVCWDEDRKMVWFALDYVDGGDLRTFLNKRRKAREPPPEQSLVRMVLTGVGSALRYIPSNNVLHRDVKPSNILISRGFEDVKLTDFGISKILETTGYAHTVLGTPSYLSPEIVSGEPYGPASDLWAFGICLYELCSLRLPFDSGNQLHLAVQIVEQAPAPLVEVTDPYVIQSIYGLLEKRPEQRIRIIEMVAPLSIDPLESTIGSNRSTVTLE